MDGWILLCVACDVLQVLYYIHPICSVSLCVYLYSVCVLLLKHHIYKTISFGMHQAELCAWLILVKINVFKSELVVA